MVINAYFPSFITVKSIVDVQRQEIITHGVHTASMIKERCIVGTGTIANTIKSPVISFSRALKHDPSL